MYPSGYHHNGFVTTHDVRLYIAILLIPVNQNVLNKQRRKCNISGHEIIFYRKIYAENKLVLGKVKVNKY